MQHMNAKFMYQPIHALRTIQVMTSIKLLYVLAPGCHSQGAF